MAGVTVAIAPSGGLNPGNQSISGEREDANGLMVNGGDVKELMDGGTSIDPGEVAYRKQACTVCTLSIHAFKTGSPWDGASDDSSTAPTAITNALP
jgi:hypothetical protein